MATAKSLREQLTHAAGSARVVVRCLNGGRDLQEPSQRAIMLLVDILDTLHRLKDLICCGAEDNQWLVEPSRLLALGKILDCFTATMRSMELYFQPGGVGVTYFRKHLLEKTFLTRLEQYKVMLLLSLQPGSSERLFFLDERIRSSLRLLREVESGPNIDPQLEERALGIASRLASQNFITLADLCNRRMEGSGGWIFDDEEYNRWLLGSTKTLYCVGPPGVGKTFLSASIVDSLQRTFTSPDVATVFVFCEDETQKEQTTLDLLQNILAQLIYRRRSLSHASSSLYHFESTIEGKAPAKAYLNAIRSEVDRFSKVFFVIDGLDMFSDKDRFLSRLQKLPDQVQLLVTLREATEVGDVSYVTVLAPHHDLKAYAISRIEEDSGLTRLLKRKSDPGLYENAVNMVADRSHGLFLLAKINLDLLSRHARKTRGGQFDQALIYFPQRLTEAYGEAMKEVVSHSPKATAYVYWTLYSLRPLSVGELKRATDSTGSETDDDSMSFEHSLETKSAGMLTVDAVSGTVRFVHRTAKEYLTGAPGRVFFPTAQKDIAETCLTAISPDEVVDDCYYNGGTSTRSSEDGFIGYATTYWGVHAREVAEDEQTIQVLIKTFLNKLLWRRPPLQVLTNEPRVPSELGLGKYPQDWTALHFLAYFGIVSRSKRLLAQGARLDENDNSFRITPLHCAASRGHLELAEFLLDNGADANPVARDGSTPLHLATQYGQRPIMRLLLNQPVNPQVANEEGETALQLAVKTEWDEATVPLLVKNKVDVNNRNIHTGDTALHLAIRWRRTRIMQHLMDKGASIDMTNEDGFTPLQLAVKVDNCEAISVLLQRRPNIESRSLSGFTALQIAVHEGHWVAFDLLIIAGADINAWNKEGESLIHEQARKATSPSIASKLLVQGANIELFNNKGLSPLHCAAAAANKTMFTFLLDQGAKPTTLTGSAESLLHITPPISQDGLVILKLALLDLGLGHPGDINTPSKNGWTPLHQAVYIGTGAPDHAFPKISEYIHLLLRHNADVNARLQASSNAETPLHLAVSAILPRPDLITLLISAGADVNAQTADGKTPLHLAAERGRESIFRILYEAGADMSLEAPDSAKADDGHGDGVGNTAFELALRNPFGRNWFEVDGKLKPSIGDQKRDSVGTVIEEDLGHEGADVEASEASEGDDEDGDVFQDVDALPRPQNGISGVTVAASKNGVVEVMNGSGRGSGSSMEKEKDVAVSLRNETLGNGSPYVIV